MVLHEKLVEKLIDQYQEMRARGDLLTREQLDHYYRMFRERFGPQRLRSLDGEALLYTMHGLGEEHRDSLVYWLEFKNDEEFPNSPFGSIAGGSALKFGIYQRQEDGAWMTGSSHKQVELSVDEAVERAREHRQQLRVGAELLQQLDSQGSDEQYRDLQRQMNTAAPDVCNTAWGHKYFHMLFPDKLDDYHVEYLQRFHLIKLLQIPPEGEGRFISAGRFVAIAAELEWSLNHLTSVLNRLHGRPYDYWRIGTKIGDDQSIWDMMLHENSVAIGWADIGDLSYVTYDRDSKETVRETLSASYPNDPRVIGRKTQEIFNFVARIDEGDIVLPSDGRRVLGIGRVIGEYAFVSGSDAPHRRPVEWLSLDEWEMPRPEGLRTTVSQVRKHDANRVEIEKHILEGSGVIELPPPPTKTPAPPPRLKGIPGRIQAILDRKKQVILYGPPGTGKTYWARKTAQDLASLARFGRLFEQVSEGERQALLAGSAAQVRMCTFHPAYGYEDFLEGFRPDTLNQQLVFEERDGIFKRLCADATENLESDFYLIIDEINRGDIPRIFGELLTILEADKRRQKILLPLSGEPFSVPDNVYIIATMNTADRSIALLDTALRRRFGFVELMPDVTTLQGAVVANTIPLGPWLASLNKRIIDHIGRDARNLQIGHAYLLQDGRPVADFQRFARILREDIIPLLQEYCYEDYTTLAHILGDSLVDVERQRIRHELFEMDRRDDLAQALLEPEPELTASSEVVASEAKSQELEEEDDLVPEEEDVAA